MDSANGGALPSSTEGPLEGCGHEFKMREISVHCVVSTTAREQSAELDLIRSGMLPGKYQE